MGGGVGGGGGGRPGSESPIYRWNVQHNKCSTQPRLHTEKIIERLRKSRVERWLIT